MRMQAAFSIGSRLLLLATASAAMWFADASSAAQQIRIGGTGNALGAMQLVAEAFKKQNPAIDVRVFPSVGTSGAIKAVPKGALDIGLSSRALTEEERKIATSFEYARTPLVFAVSKRTQVNAINFSQIADIYNGNMTNWPDGTRIRPILRLAGDENTRQVKQMSPAIEQALTAAELRPGLAFATNDQEAADKAEIVPGALAVTTLSLINSEERPLRALVLNGVEPTVVNGVGGKYPHMKHFYLLTQPIQSTEVKRFIAFMQSAEGREILIRAGNWIP